MSGAADGEAKVTEEMDSMVTSDTVATKLQTPSL